MGVVVKFLSFPRTLMINLFFEMEEWKRGREMEKEKSRKSLQRVASHEGPFKPSCTGKGAPFQPVKYK